MCFFSLGICYPLLHKIVSEILCPECSWGIYGTEQPACPAKARLYSSHFCLTGSADCGAQNVALFSPEGGDNEREVRITQCYKKLTLLTIGLRKRETALLRLVDWRRKGTRSGSRVYLVENGQTALTESHYWASLVSAVSTHPSLLQPFCKTFF